MRDPSLLERCADRFGAQCMVVAIDAKRRGDGWEVFVDAGRTPAGRDALEWAAEATAQRGAGEILLTSMDRDGTGEGFDLELLEAVARETTVPLVASGGAGTVEHFAEALAPGRADAVLAAQPVPLRGADDPRGQGAPRGRADPGAAVNAVPSSTSTRCGSTSAA